MLARDSDGRLIFPGRVPHKLEFDAWGAGALPSWLTLDTSSNGAGSAASFVGPDTSEGYCQLTTAANSSARAMVAGPSIDLTNMEALRITVQGVYFGPSDAINANLGFWTSGTPINAGARLHATHTGSNVFTVFGASGGSVGDEDPNYVWLDGTSTNEYTHKRNLSFVLSRQRNNHDAWWGYIMTDDDVWFKRRCSTSDPSGPGGASAGNMGTAALVQPRFQVGVDTGSSAVWARFERLIVEGWTF